MFSLPVLLPIDRLQAQINILYDPWDWVTYKNSQYISSITEGREYIYFATNGGILRYQLYGKYWDYPITRSQGLSDDDVDAVHYDFQTHILWAATASGLNYSMEGGRKWEQVSNETLTLRPREKVLQIGSTPDYLWCITSSQILKLDHLSGFVISPYADIPKDNVTWGSALFTGKEIQFRILNDFIATGGWINDVTVFHGPHLEEVDISTLYSDRFGDLWLGTWGGSVFFGDFQMRQINPIPFGPAQTGAEIILQTDRGMWMGGIDPSSFFSGITRYDTVREKWDLFRVGYEINNGNDQVYCSVQVNNELWFGTQNGIQIYSLKQNSWFLLSPSKGLPDHRINCLEFDGNYVYAGTTSGIVRISPVSKTRVPWSLAKRTHLSSIYTIFWDGDNLWISASNNLWQWKASTDLVTRYGMFGNRPEDTGSSLNHHLPDIMAPVTAIVSSDSMVYFGDEFGILLYHKFSGEWSRITGESRLVGFHVLSLELTEDSKGNTLFLWMGTSRGVFAVDLAEGYIRHFTQEDGLPSNWVRSTIIDRNIAWFGTPEGLVRFTWKKYLE